MATPQRKLISIKRRGSRKTLVITIPLLEWSVPRFRYAIEYGFALGLLVGGIAGLTASLAPSVFSPVSSSVVAEAPSEPISQPAALQPSIPTRLEIPDINLATDLIQLGKNDDGSLETPTDYEEAGWYKYSPTPGELGPAIIAGHVDSYLGPAIFFYLKDLHPGQLIYIHRHDGTSLTFKVDNVSLFDQKNFPTEAVYGNIDYAGLRLITCGGVYSPLTNSYSHNTVVYASLVKSEAH